MGVDARAGGFCVCLIAVQIEKINRNNFNSLNFYSKVYSNQWCYLASVGNQAQEGTLKIKICRTPPGVWHVEMQGRGRDWHGESFASRHLALQALALRLQNYPLHLLAHVKNGVWMDPLAIPEDPAAAAARGANSPRRGSAPRTRRRLRKLPLVRDESVIL